MIFSVDYPYEQMSAVGRWFDELLIANDLKAKIGRKNANTLLKLGLLEHSVSPPSDLDHSLDVVLFRTGGVTHESRCHPGLRRS